MEAKTVNTVNTERDERSRERIGGENSEAHTAQQYREDSNNTGRSARTVVTYADYVSGRYIPRTEREREIFGEAVAGLLWKNGENHQRRVKAVLEYDGLCAGIFEYICYENNRAYFREDAKKTVRSCITFILNGRRKVRLI